MGSIHLEVAVAQMTYAEARSLQIPRDDAWKAKRSAWASRMLAGLGIFTPILWLMGLFTLRTSWMVKRVLLGAALVFSPFLIQLPLYIIGRLFRADLVGSIGEPVGWITFGSYYLGSVVCASIMNTKVLLFLYLKEERDAAAEQVRSGTLGTASPVPLPPGEMVTPTTRLVPLVNEEPLKGTQLLQLFDGGPTIPRTEKWRSYHLAWMLIGFLSLGWLSWLGWIIAYRKVPTAWMLTRMRIGLAISSAAYVALLVILLQGESLTDSASSLGLNPILTVGMGVSLFASLFYAGLWHPEFLRSIYNAEEESRAELPAGHRSARTAEDTIETLIQALSKDYDVPQATPQPPYSIPAPGTAKPDVTTYTHRQIGSWQLLDFNSITSQQLQSEGSLSPQHADLIVSTRTAQGGFRTMGHLIQSTQIPISDLLPLFGRAIFDPYQGN